MELDDRKTLQLVQERIQAKVYSFNDWATFITWLKGMTAVKFKAFIVQCIDDVVADGDVEKADLLEIKSSIES